MTDATTTPTDKAEPVLLPCPFCGGEAWLNDYEAKHSELPPQSRAPQCRSCGVSPGYLPTAKKAIAAWNTRTHPHPSLSVGLDREAVARVRDLADAIGAHLLGSPGNFEIAVSYLDETERDLRSLLALAAPAEGYVLVPVEPTEAMIEAGTRTVNSFGRVSNGVCNAYRKMVQIAACLPAAPTGETGA